jgi:hypothetical protein
MSLPTWTEICDDAARSLNTSRNRLSDARDSLNSDCSPAGGSLHPVGADRRDAAMECITKAKGLIDQAKRHLDAARTLGPRR